MRASSCQNHTGTWCPLLCIPLRWMAQKSAYTTFKKRMYCVWGAVNVLAPLADGKGSAFKKQHWKHAQKRVFPASHSGVNLP